MASESTHLGLDKTGIILSTLCFLHCLAVPLLATGALAWLASESIHTGLTLALVGVVFLVAWPSYKQHHRINVPVLLVLGLSFLILAVLSEDSLGEKAEIILTALGSVILIGGHMLNLRFRRRK